MGPTLILIFQVFRIYLIPSPPRTSPFEEPLIGTSSFCFEAILHATFFILLWSSLRRISISYIPRGGSLYNIVALWLLPSPSREWILFFEVLVPPLSSREIISFLKMLISPFIFEELFPPCNLCPRGSLFPSFKCLFHSCPWVTFPLQGAVLSRNWFPP